jgi:hypothetical protein
MDPQHWFLDITAVFLFRSCLGLRVDKLEMVEASLPILSLNSQGRIRIEVPQHVKLVLR